MGIFDVGAKILSSGYSRLPMNKQMDLYFNDYELTPLIFHENYLHAIGQQDLSTLADVADSISVGNMVASTIRSQQQWSLLPASGICSVVYPASRAKSEMRQRLQFPSLLGKISTTNKHLRLLSLMSWHSQQRCHMSPMAFRSLYVYPMLIQIHHLYTSEDVDGLVDLVDAMALTKDDMDALWLMSVGTLNGEVMKKVPTKVKSQVTKRLNADVMLPFDANLKMKKSRNKASALPSADVDEAEMDDMVESADESDGDTVGALKRVPMASKPIKRTSKEMSPKPLKKKRVNYFQIKALGSSEADLAPKPLVYKYKEGFSAAVVKPFLYDTYLSLVDPEECIEQ